MPQLLEIARHIEVVHEGLAGSWEEERHQDLDQRGLASTVGAEHAENLPARPRGRSRPGLRRTPDATGRRAGARWSEPLPIEGGQASRSPMLPWPRPSLWIHGTISPATRRVPERDSLPTFTTRSAST